MIFASVNNLVKNYGNHCAVDNSEAKSGDKTDNRMCSAGDSGVPLSYRKGKR